MPEKDPASMSLEIDDLFAAALASVENIQQKRRTVSPDDAEEAEVDAGSAVDLDAEIEVEVDLDDLGDDGEAEDEEDGLTHLAEEEILRLEQEKAALEAALSGTQEEAERLRRELQRGRALVLRARERLEQSEEARARSEEARRSAEAGAQQLREEHEKLKAQLRHIQDRRRQEQEESRRYGHSKAVVALLPVLDNLTLAITHADADPQAVLKGVQMVISQFHGALQHMGVTPVDARVGQPFQPEHHEAMLYSPTDELPPGQVMREIAAGYTLHGRLLRAARVAVSAPPLPAPEPAAALEDAAESGEPAAAPGAALEVPAELEAESPLSPPEEVDGAQDSPADVVPVVDDTGGEE